MADAYFATLSLDARVAEQSVLLEDLEARLRETRARVDAGVALQVLERLTGGEFLDDREPVPASAPSTFQSTLRPPKSNLSLSDGRITFALIDRSSVGCLPVSFPNAQPKSVG